MQRAVSAGWRNAARPLVSDYLDRLADDVGTPPDIECAQALVSRLPGTVRIDGSKINGTSQPGLQRRLDSDDDRLSRRTADGHHITFGLDATRWQGGPHGIGWIVLALLLVFITLAYAYMRRLLRPLTDIRAGTERFGSGMFDKSIPLRRRDELGDLALLINTLAQRIAGMLDAKRGLLLAPSHELRSPLMRARLNAELLPTTPAGDTPG